MASNSTENASMDQVRELLMGTQFKDMENRVLRQEERFLQELAGLRETLKTRVDSLENFMKSEAASLLHRLKEEKVERATAIKGEQKDRNEALKQEKRERDEGLARLAKELAKLNESCDRKLAALSTTLDTTETELRELLLAESSRLSEATEEKYKEALAALSRTNAQIQHDHVSRSLLSATFTEFAMKMAGDLTLAGETATGEPLGADS